MSDIVRDQQVFMEAGNQTTGVINAIQTETYIKLCTEEHNELIEAFDNEPVENILKEAIDNIVVNLGLIISFGVNPYNVWLLVWNHNMLKTRNVKKDASGKIIKSPESIAAKKQMMIDIKELINAKL